MAESAAYPVEEIIPPVPVRQWMLSFPSPSDVPRLDGKLAGDDGTKYIGFCEFEVLSCRLFAQEKLPFCWWHGVYACNELAMQSNAAIFSTTVNFVYTRSHGVVA